MIITCDRFNGVFELRKKHRHMLALLLCLHIVLRDEYIEEMKLHVSVAVSLYPEVSLLGVNVPRLLKGQQWKIIFSFPLNAVTTQTTTTRHVPVC